jgi:hypothetical protein
MIHDNATVCCLDTSHNLPQGEFGGATTCGVKNLRHTGVWRVHGEKMNGRNTILM